MLDLAESRISLLEQLYLCAVANSFTLDCYLRLNVTKPVPHEIFIGFGPAALTLSANRDLVEAAANLFQTLRQADNLAGPTGHIAIAPVPETGLGRAINDRLRRAAAPRA